MGAIGADEGLTVGWVVGLAVGGSTITGALALADVTVTWLSEVTLALAAAVVSAVVNPPDDTAVARELVAAA